MTQRVIKSVLAALVILGSMQAQAGDDVDISLNGALKNISPQVRDGQLIGQGQISTQQPHSGYQVWLKAERVGEAPDRYVLTGVNNSQHKLYVIIGQNGWVPDTRSGTGIIKQTGEVQARFDIVANGQQNVPADIYDITVNGRYIEP
ncbi:invasin [Salmonella enterica]|nr:invasin [Salmonella enterica]